MTAKASARSPITFHDVAMYFSEEEWEFLEEWQKELYKNVMCEIHGALISMGYAIVNPGKLFQVKKEEKPFAPNLPACKKAEYFQGHTSGSTVVCPDILLRIKQEENPVIYSPPPCKKRENMVNLAPHHPAEPSVISVHIKEEEDPYMSEPQHSDRSESFSSPTASSPIVTSVFSLHNKPVDSSYSNGRQDVGKGFLAYSPEDGSIKRREKPSEEFTKDRKLNESVQANPRESTTPYSSKRLHCERNNSTRGPQGSIPGYKPERNVECERSFHHLTNPIVQQIIHAGDMPYTCFEFIDERWTQKEKRIYYCNDCGRGFWKLYCFKVHQRTHTGEKPYTCTECEKSFSQSSNLIRHQKIHTGDKPYRCTDCDKTFSQSSTLAKHQSTHIRVGYMQCRTLS